jgi:hypothetical protein
MPTRNQPATPEDKRPFNGRAIPANFANRRAEVLCRFLIRKPVPLRVLLAHNRGRRSPIFSLDLRMKIFGLLVALAVVPAIFPQNPRPAPPKPSDYSFKASTERVWTDTGLDLEPGDRVHVYGAVAACEGQTPSEKAHLPLPSAPAGALLVKLHGESGPILASPDADIPIIDNGRLYLGINGWHCHGTIATRVHVTWHQAKPSK